MHGACVAEIGRELEARLTGVITAKLFADVSLVLFNTTSTYFEGAGPDTLAAFGFSRDKRGDRPHANLVLLTSREGRDQLRLGSFVVVADRGMVSAANLDTYAQRGSSTSSPSDCGGAPRTPRSHALAGTSA